MINKIEVKYKSQSKSNQEKNKEQNEFAKIFMSQDDKSILSKSNKLQKN